MLLVYVGYKQIEVFPTGTGYQISVFVFVLTRTKYRILKFKVGWTSLDTEFLYLNSFEPEPEQNFVFQPNIRLNTKFSRKAYFNFRILSFKDTNIIKGKNMVKFWSKPNFFSQFRFWFNRNRTFEKQVRFGWKGIRNSAEYGISAEFFKFVCTLIRPKCSLTLKTKCC